ncbi:peptide/nickel transport system substrate-binding protein [Hoeflea marina]|uniref:Peptide/nickel transport system substrate-binding protein n=1 Tax=Hoeflea marina TaxID=274592 RepID=A0A317PIN1_9HYPH|nr:ABC transporter substrate-binding protein [Hoeflea marina]PWW00302.1 peptide/nickel transport system substrate-binding protein [Hoeflea marina]
MKHRMMTAGILLAGGLAVFAGTTDLALAGPDTNILNVGIAAPDAGRLDPHLSATTIDKAVFGWMFNGLVRLKPGTASPETVEPDLAESWETSADGLDWTFHLRQGVQCHHGYGELTSADIVYSLNRAADPNRSSFSGDFSVFDKVEAVDPYTVKIVLKNPVPSLLGLVTNYHGGNIVCMKAAEEMGEDFQKRPIGTGPFMYGEYKPQQSLMLVANPDYFRGKPELDGINYQYVPSDSARDLAFQSGELDMLYGKQDQTWVERTKQVEGAVVHVMEPAEMSVMSLNITSKPLDDIRVRQAIAMAVDRDQFMEFKGRDVTRVAKSVVPQGYLGYADMSELMPKHDVAGAKALLAEAGFPDGVTLKVIHTALPGMLGTMEVFQAQLAEAGIKLDLEVVEHATFHAQIRKDLSQIVHYSAARFPVADTYLTQFFHSGSIVGTPTGITNFSHCAVADKEIEAARVEQDPEAQKQLWKTAQEKIMAEVCGIPIYENLQIWATKTNLDLGYELIGSLSLGPPVTEKTHFIK